MDEKLEQVICELNIAKPFLPDNALEFQLGMLADTQRGVRRALEAAQAIETDAEQRNEHEGKNAG